MKKDFEENALLLQDVTTLTLTPEELREFMTYDASLVRKFMDGYDFVRLITPSQPWKMLFNVTFDVIIATILLMFLTPSFGTIAGISVTICTITLLRVALSYTFSTILSKNLRRKMDTKQS